MGSFCVVVDTILECALPSVGCAVLLILSGGFSQRPSNNKSQKSNKSKQAAASRNRRSQLFTVWGWENQEFSCWRVGCVIRCMGLAWDTDVYTTADEVKSFWLDSLKGNSDEVLTEFPVQGHLLNPLAVIRHDFGGKGKHNLHCCQSVQSATAKSSRMLTNERALVCYNCR